MFGGISFEKTMLVTVTGIVIVFIVLFLLIMIIQMFGKFFSGKGGNGKSDKSGKNRKDSSEAGKTAAKNAPQKMTADDDGELVAVITAAAMSALSGDGKKYAIRSISPARPVFGGSAWRTAGLLENTRPF